MTIEIINKSEYEETIKSLFSEDPLLINKFHINFGKGINSCVERTVSDMMSFENYILFGIKHEGKIISFFGKETINENDFLTGFFIKVNYRVKDFVLRFWEIVENTFKSKNLFSCVYEHNKRAIDFLSKKGSIFGKHNNVIIFKLF